MIIETLQILFDRDLNRLKKEVELYTDEKSLWLTEKNIANSAGNLCLHLIGNLNTYIGKEIGKIEYIRYRDAEFSLKNIPRAELMNMIENTIKIVRDSLSQLNENDLNNEYPILVFEKKTSTEFFLIHLATHLTYHLGQINYHRRLIDN